MIANVYEAVLDQDRFDELITLAESSITNRSAHRELLRRKRDIEAHFETAEKLLSSLQKPAEDYDRPVIRLGRDLTVLQANETAERILQITAGRSLEELDIDGDALGHLNEAVSGRAEDWPIVRVPHAATGKQVLLVLSAEEDPHNGKIWLLTGVERVWQQGASLAMQSLYGLTQSETDVLSMLVSGHTPAEIAEARDRSVETVRQQIKSMITKTRSRGSGELVAVARAIANSAQRRKPQTTSADHTRAELRLRDGRKIDYLEQGDTTGKAVVFLHGCLCGNRLPNTTNRYFSENGIRLLSPARPWHGQSDGHGILLHDPARYAHDICDWLDQLDLEQVQLVAFDVGAIFALVCLPHLRDRVAQLICISAQPPCGAFRTFPEHRRSKNCLPCCRVSQCRF